MNVRHVVTARQPLRVLIDSRLEVNPAARIVEDGGTLVICAVPEPARSEQTAALVERGCEVLTLAAESAGGAPPTVDLAAVLAELARREMNEVHVEAGARLSGALLQAGLVDELLLYLAPKLLGDAMPWAALPEVSAIEQAWAFRYRSIERIGEDVRLIARREEDRKESEH